MEITFQKGRLEKEVKVGYSWTVALFGPIPLAMRGMWGWCVMSVAVNFLTYGFVCFLLGAFANKAYARKLVEQGWEHKDPEQLPVDWEIAK